MAHVCNPSAEATETKGSGAHWPASQQIDVLRFHGGLSLKTNRWRAATTNIHSHEHTHSKYSNIIRYMCMLHVHV